MNFYLKWAMLPTLVIGSTFFAYTVLSGRATNRGVNWERIGRLVAALDREKPTSSVRCTMDLMSRGQELICSLTDAGAAGDRFSVKEEPMRSEKNGVGSESSSLSTGFDQIKACFSSYGSAKDNLLTITVGRKMGKYDYLSLRFERKEPLFDLLRSEVRDSKTCAVIRDGGHSKWRQVGVR